VNCHEEHRSERIARGYVWLIWCSIVFAIDLVCFIRDTSVGNGVWTIVMLGLAAHYLRCVIVNRRTLHNGTCPCRAEAK
jgi:hypothetical protein